MTLALHKHTEGGWWLVGLRTCGCFTLCLENLTSAELTVLPHLMSLGKGSAKHCQWLPAGHRCLTDDSPVSVIPWNIRVWVSSGFGWSRFPIIRRLRGITHCLSLTCQARSCTVRALRIIFFLLESVLSKSLSLAVSQRCVHAHNTFVVCAPTGHSYMRNMLILGSQGQ